jgi:hypothetical protein
MANNPGPKGPLGKSRQQTSPLRQKAWLAMQIKGKFSLSDLVRNAVPDGSTAKDPRNNLGRYLKALTRVGILVEMKRRLTPTAPTSNGEKRWMLVRDLGRVAPVMRSLNQVYDPNAKVLILAPVIDEEAGHAE